MQVKISEVIAKAVKLKDKKVSKTYKTVPLENKDGAIVIPRILL